MKVRIGIDVGGTFTDAAVINNETFELIGTLKVPTTHSAANGVAKGIIDVLEGVMKKFNIAPEDVTFIAHGTTQATNALLEGDVVKVGVLSMGSGMEGMKTKSDTEIGNIELAPGKFLKTENYHIQFKDGEREAEEAVKALMSAGAKSIVAAEAFSVDHPENESQVQGKCAQVNMPCTATHEISKLYGLKIRTRTAVINASILPKMLDTANMTDSSVKNAGIESPLMIMRCDGGVMSVDEVRKRPILTVLSGPAAGVAGALMYEKLTDGIFLEVGGTSTDISAVKDGKVMIQYAEIGGHKTYLNSLDVRTVGIGGGSMVQISNGKASNVGPRSAHIAGLGYEVYASPEDIVDPVLETIVPIEGDPAYGYIKCSNGKKFALTLAGAANIAGYVHEEDYAYGNIEAAKKAYEPLAKNMNMTVEQVAERIIEMAADKNGEVVKALIKDYNLDPRTTVLIGGGGGCAAVVPSLGKHIDMKHKLAKNAPVISTIGVALAMVRDVVERTIPNPTEEDIIRTRKEAEEAVLKAGAAPGTVEVQVEVDSQKNIVRAIAVGSTEFRAKDLMKKELTQKELLDIAAHNLETSPDKLKIEGSTSYMYAITHECISKKLFGFIKKKNKALRIIDKEGVIRLQKNNALCQQTNVNNFESSLRSIMEEVVVYGDGGTEMPNIYIICGKRLIDLSGLQSVEQIISLAKVEINGLSSSEPMILVVSKRMEG